MQGHAKLAAKHLGAASITFDNFPDNKMDTVSLLEVIKKIENFIVLKKPDIIFTHHSDDINIDHDVTQRAVLTAARSLPGSKISEIYASEILSSSEFGKPQFRLRPDCYFKVSNEDIDSAVKALECYKSEIRTWPHPRSINALKASFKLRGSECGYEAAEVFEVLRIIN